MVFLLLIGCFALTIVSFAYFTKTTAPVDSVAETEAMQPAETIKDGEFLWEVVSRQFLTTVFTK